MTLPNLEEVHARLGPDAQEGWKQGLESLAIRCDRMKQLHVSGWMEPALRQSECLAAVAIISGYTGSRRNS